MNEQLFNVEAAAEAARQWGLDESTVKKKCDSPNSKLEWKKSGRVKLVTRNSMDTEFSTILNRILAGKHNDPAYGVQVLLKRCEYTREELKAAGIPDEYLKESELND